MSGPPASLPPVLYVPTSELAAEGRAHIAMTTLADGRMAGFAYSAIDRLTEFNAQDAPWALLSIADLQRAHADVPFDVLLVDQRPVVAPQEVRGADEPAERRLRGTGALPDRADSRCHPLGGHRGIKPRRSRRRRHDRVGRSPVRPSSR